MRLRASVLTLTVASAAYITSSVWLAYLQRYGVFATEPEAEKICGKMNVAVEVHADEEPMRKWITAKLSGNANAAELDKLHQDLKKWTSVRWMCHFTGQSSEY